MAEENHLSKQLREAVDKALENGFSRYAIAKKAGVNHFVLTEWYDKGKDIRLDTAAKLAGVFRMRLTKPTRFRE